MNLHDAALYICGTPIGNLEDASPRLVRVIGECELVASEDTRRTRTLMSALGVSLTGRKIISIRADNESAGALQLVDALRRGKSVAYMSDAGMPGISDPGGILVASARSAGFRVIVVPGPSAVSTALAASGNLHTRYTFVGFFPRSTRELSQLFEDHSNTTIVGFESPRRCRKTIATIADIQPARTVTICRELTKVHECIVAGEAAALAEDNQPEVEKGEIALVLAPVEIGRVLDEQVDGRYLDLVEDINAEGVSLKDATRIVAARFSDHAGVSKKQLYDAILQRRKSAGALHDE